VAKDRCTENHSTRNKSPEATERTINSRTTTRTSNELLWKDNSRCFDNGRSATNATLEDVIHEVCTLRGLPEDTRFSMTESSRRFEKDNKVPTLIGFVKLSERTKQKFYPIQRQVIQSSPVVNSPRSRRSRVFPALNQPANLRH
jgi:hypothetical protein